MELANAQQHTEDVQKINNLITEMQCSKARHEKTLENLDRENTCNTKQFIVEYEGKLEAARTQQSALCHLASDRAKTEAEARFEVIRQEDLQRHEMLLEEKNQQLRDTTQLCRKQLERADNKIDALSKEYEDLKMKLLSEMAMESERHEEKIHDMQNKLDATEQQMFIKLTEINSKLKEEEDTVRNLREHIAKNQHLLSDELEKKDLEIALKVEEAQNEMVSVECIIAYKSYFF